HLARSADDGRGDRAGDRRYVALREVRGRATSAKDRRDRTSGAAMNYFITGATGFIGGEIARQLVGAGHRVIGLVRDPDRGAELASLGVVLARGDITDRESMREPMIGVDGVFHVAGWYRLGAKNKGAGMRVNVDGTRNVLELMKELKIPKGVYTSTVAV